MDTLDVVALVEGVDRRLPVAVPLDGPVAGHDHPLEMVGVELARKRIEKLQKRFRLGVHGEPDETAPAVARQLDQPVTGRALRKGLDIRNPANPAVQVVFPMMVAALQRVVRMAEARRGDPIAPVLTDVEEGADRAVPLAHDQNRFPADVVNVMVARLRDRIFATGHEPDLRPQRGPFPFHEFRAGVVLLRNDRRAEIGPGGFHRRKLCCAGSGSLCRQSRPAVQKLIRWEKPPSTGICVPLTQLAAGLARNTTYRAISSAVERRRNGCCRRAAP